MLVTCFSTAPEGDDQFPGDGGVGAALGDQRQRLDLALGELGERVTAAPSALIAHE